MNEVIIKYLDILKIKFIGPKELIQLVKKYYVGLETQNCDVDYTIQLSNKSLPKNIEIPAKAKFEKCFAGPYYYFWKDNEYNLAYSPAEKQCGEHFVLRKENNLRIFVTEEKILKSIIGISRELLVEKIIERGFMPIHASAIEKGGEGYVFFGNKNNGKSTSFFSSIIYDNAYPVSGDVSFLGKEKNRWVILGFPWTATIDKSYFDIIKKTPIHNTRNNGKIKFYPDDLCKEFKKEWIWKVPLKEIINVNLNPSVRGKKEHIASLELKERLIKSGTEDWWTWSDVFGIGKKCIKYEYEDLSKSINGSILCGNIIQYFKEKSLEK